MFITIINDCRDANAMGRQATRAMQLFPGSPVTNIGIAQNELEAAGNLIDMLDAASGQQGCIFVNVAPRQGRGKKWPNGTPFGYFFYEKTLIVTTIAEQCLSLIKKLGLTSVICLTDVAVVADAMVAKEKVSSSMRDLMVKSQFRSYDYMPFLAKWVLDKEQFPTQEYAIENIPDAPKAIWWIDNFGNCKTTIFPEEVEYKIGSVLASKVGEIMCYEHLKDLDNDASGFIIGSSGLKERRFLELVVQGNSAAKRFKLTTGMELF